MITLLIIADDFTGALDTGVQFAAHGAIVQVETNPIYDFSLTDCRTQVLVLDTETRHLSAAEAYQVVFRVAKAAQAAGIPYIYKKTDSGLRGNVGSELAAVMDGVGVACLPFIPAFPKMGRTTKDGVHYVDDLPVSETAFGSDPFTPVSSSSIPEILACQTGKAVHVINHPEQHSDAGICVYDAENDETLWQIGNALTASKLHLSAGCAGFGAVLADLLGLRGDIPPLPQMQPGLFVVCGSIHPVTRRQIAFAADNGFRHIQLDLMQKLDPTWLSSDNCAETLHQWLKQANERPCWILDSNDPLNSDQTLDFAKKNQLSLESIRTHIADALGEITRRLMHDGLKSTLLCTGGDTLLALMKAVGISSLTPLREVAAGAVLSQFVLNGTTWNIISKSGGFGEEDLFRQLAQLVGAGANKEGHSC